LWENLFVKHARQLKWLLPLVLLALLLTACGGVVSAPPAAAESAASDLPGTVTVATVAGIHQSEDVFLLDVREQWEYDEGHIPGVYLIPTGQVPARLDEIPTDKTVIVTCRTGNRSAQVTDFLRRQGFTNVHNMAGGIVAWDRAGYPVER
jgi:phage shock protein E